MSEMEREKGAETASRRFRGLVVEFGTQMALYAEHNGIRFADQRCKQKS